MPPSRQTSAIVYVSAPRTGPAARALAPRWTTANRSGVVRHADHPAGAILYAEWMLSEGQKVIVELGRDATLRDLLATGDAESVSVDVTELAERERDWADRWERLLRLGKAGPEG